MQEQRQDHSDHDHQHNSHNAQCKGSSREAFPNGRPELWMGNLSTKIASQDKKPGTQERHSKNAANKVCEQLLLPSQKDKAKEGNTTDSPYRYRGDTRYLFMQLQVDF